MFPSRQCCGGRWLARRTAALSLPDTFSRAGTRNYTTVIFWWNWALARRLRGHPRSRPAIRSDERLVFSLRPNRASALGCPYLLGRLGARFLLALRV
jgi:hypothetical protein